MAEIMALGFEALIQDRRVIMRVIVDLIKSQDGQRADGLLLKPLYHYIINQVTNPLVQSMFKLIIKSTATFMRTRVIGAGSGRPTGDWITLGDFAERLSVRKSWLREELVRAGFLPAALKSHKDLGIDERLADELFELQYDNITYEEAAGKFGLSRVQFAAVGGPILVRLKAKGRGFGCGRRLLSRTKVEAFAKNLFERPIQPRPNVCQIDLKGAIRIGNAKGLSQSLVISLVIAGSIRGNGLKSAGRSVWNLLFGRDQALGVLTEAADRLSRRDRHCAEYALAS